MHFKRFNTSTNSDSIFLFMKMNKNLCKSGVDTSKQAITASLFFWSSEWTEKVWDSQQILQKVFFLSCVHRKTVVYFYNFCKVLSLFSWRNQFCIGQCYIYFHKNMLSIFQVTEGLVVCVTHMLILHLNILGKCS